MTETTGRGYESEPDVTSVRDILREAERGVNAKKKRFGWYSYRRIRAIDRIFRQRCQLKSPATVVSRLDLSRRAVPLSSPPYIGVLRTCSGIRSASTAPRRRRSTAGSSPPAVADRVVEVDPVGRVVDFPEEPAVCAPLSVCTYCTADPGASCPSLRCRCGSATPFASSFETIGSVRSSRPCTGRSKLAASRVAVPVHSDRFVHRVAGVVPERRAEPEAAPGVPVAAGRERVACC